VPRNTDIVYIAQERVTFFYSVLPAGNAPSTSKRIDFTSGNRLVTREIKQKK